MSISAFRARTALVVIAASGTTWTLGAPPNVPQFPRGIDLWDLSAPTGCRLPGAVSGTLSGYSIAGLGDVNGDGYDDIVIAAPRDSADEREFAGASYVVFGGVGAGASGTIDLASIDGTNGFVVQGPQAGVMSGWKVSRAGDVNGDGFNDVFVASLYTNHDDQIETPGQAWVLFGAADLGSSGAVDLATLDSGDGFLIESTNPEDYSFRGISEAGDVNGDGLGDLIISAEATVISEGVWGTSYVVFGSETIGASGPVVLQDLSGPDGFIIPGIAFDYGWSHASVASGGDVNGDGFDDLVIGSHYVSWSVDPAARETRYGAAHVVFGSATIGSEGSLDLAAINGTNGFVIFSEASTSLGDVVSGVGDVNDDGFDDVLVGWQHGWFDPTGTQWYALVFGGADVGSDGTLAAEELDGPSGFIIGLDPEFYGTPGFPTVTPPWDIAGLGDINGDGIDDFAIGAFEDFGSSTMFGTVYCILGATALGASGFMDLSDLNGLNGFVAGHSRFEAFDRKLSVSGAGDFNADGFNDVLIGLPNAFHFPPYSHRGVSYMIFGRKTWRPNLSAADIDGDADVDVADFNLLARDFGRAAEPNTRADLNGDGAVNVLDFTILAAEFGSRAAVE